MIVEAKQFKELLRIKGILEFVEKITDGNVLVLNGVQEAREGLQELIEEAEVQ